MSESTAVTKPAPKAVEAETLGVSLAKYQDRVQKLAPKHFDAVRYLTMAHMAIRNSEPLQKSTMASIGTAIMRIAHWGLDIGSTAYLVPFWNKDLKVFEATPVADYKGLIQLMVECGARAVDAEVVREGDAFEYEYGTSAFLKHRPASSKGKITHVYCVVRLGRGGEKFHVMTYAEVDAIRQAYSKQWTKGDVPPWYMKKTVIRQTAKLVPMYGEKVHRLMAAIEQDAEITDIQPDSDTVSGEVRSIPSELPRRDPTHKPLGQTADFNGEVNDDGASWQDDRDMEGA